LPNYHTSELRPLLADAAREDERVDLPAQFDVVGADEAYDAVAEEVKR